MYQKNLYRNADINGFVLCPLNTNETVSIDRFIKKLAGKRAIFHQHWLTPIFINEIDLEIGYRTVDRYINQLMILKNMGVKLCWTMHNLTEHDIKDYQVKINLYLLRKMALISDVIFIHHVQVVQVLVNTLGIPISKDKFFVLPHPLYDNWRQFKNVSLPREIKTDIQDSKILLISGFIKPYKGLQELIKVIKLNIKEYLDIKIHLIVAGVVQDNTAYSMLNDLKIQYPSLVSIVPRRISDEEMAGLLNYADLMVIPYRAVLTSGNYYAAATFSLPVLVPNLGMFTEVIHDGEDGFVYDGTIEGLASKLLSVMQLTKAQLKQVGQNAYLLNKDNTIENFSKIYFKRINELFCND